MRRLISKKDIEELIRMKKSVLVVEKGTLVTPMARDMARENGITITENSADVCNKDASEAVKNPVQNAVKSGDVFPELSAEIVTGIIRKMLLDGQLNDMINTLRTKSFCLEKDACGFRLIRGNTVTVDEKNTYQEIFSGNSEFANAGFWYIGEAGSVIEKSEQMIAYLIQGILDYQINGAVYTAYPGDVIYLPADVPVKIIPHFKNASLFCVKQKKDQ